MLVVQERFIAAAQAMKQDAWWWNGNGQSNKSIKRQILKEMLFSKKT
jgi:glutamate-1-semialdehyde 2,1-aminomutase